MIDRIKFIDPFDNELIAPKTFNLRSEPIGRRSAILEIAFSDIARDFGDGCFTPRHVEVSGKIWASSDAEFNEKWDLLAKFLVQENLKIQFRGRQINTIRVENVGLAYPSPTDYHFGEIAITFLCVDPFWYALISQTKEFITGGVSPFNFAITPAGNIPVFPEIKITNNADNTSFSLKNITDGNRSFAFADAGSTIGKIVTINCKTGEVKLDGINKIASFSGLFLRLLGGRENQLRYEGASAKLEFLFYEAWL